MKCSFCGNELENSAEFCPQCGMILGLENSKDDKDTNGQEEVFRVPEYIPNVFTPVEQETEEEETARILEINPEEEFVTVTENIPEYVSSVPENEPLQIEETVKEEQVQAEETAEETEEELSETTDDAEETVEDTEETVEETEEVQATEENEEPAEEAEEPQVDTQTAEESETLVVEEIEEPVYEDFKEETAAEEGVLLGITVPDEEISYPEYEDYNAKNKEESITPEEEQYEDITDYVPVKKKKSAKGFTAVLLIAIICVIFGGLYMTDSLPAFLDKPTTQTTLDNTTEDDTTQEDTTEEYTTEDTTAEDTTEEDTTVEGTTEEDTTEEDTTEEVTTTVPATVTTTQVVTSAVTTTRPQTTTVAQTTTAATTRPQTTTSATTDPYGINDVQVKKPSTFYSSSKTLYCTAEGVILRSGPATSYDRVLYLSKGADLTVLAEEKGFYYVRSNRYGVYGWVSGSYVSSSRSETEETRVHTGTVKPDKYYEKAEVRYATDGLNMRKGPGTDYGIVTVVIKNYPVKVIGYSSKNSGWVYVTDTTYGTSGWVSAAYLK